MGGGVGMHRKILFVLAAVVLAAGVGECGGAALGHSLGTARSNTAPAPSGSTALTADVRQSASGAGSLRVLIEPKAGIAPIYRLITGARSAVDLTMYELADLTAEADLAHDAARGVDVRVILDQHLEKSRNLSAYAYLAAHGVHVRWRRPVPTYHQKALRHR